MDIEITEATAVEAALVHHVMQAAFAQYSQDCFPAFAAHHESVDDVAAAMRQGGAALAWLWGEAVGSARYRLQSEHFIIERVSVLPEYQGRGIAGAMMSYLETVAASYGYSHVELMTRQSLTKNIALYQRLGYELMETDSATGRVWMTKRLEEDTLVLA
ncbi:MAG: GNAT family N-acetyltransferase [Anaerolineae bacterium]|nr:GNAT family N-acetyltransferase [Anaerolineae bacterium]MCA9907092.1 GNAT family N-acetyltransferase [Anaerolineae bacterium]